ncbi:MAG TPA: hypothetical protein EYP10_04775, partial [Armatimonadetes bacterium]|nr:hypothetical protein [Armatimonadota bacterium]
ALGLEAPMGQSDVALCAQLMSTDGERVFAIEPLQVTCEEVQSILTLIENYLEPRMFNLFRANTLNHLLVWHDGNMLIHCTPPKEADGQELVSVLPQGEREFELQVLIYDVMELLDDCELNIKRRDEGKKPINLLWMYAPGRPPDLPSFPIAVGMLFVDALTSHLPFVGACRAISIHVHRTPTASADAWMDNLRESYERLVDTIVKWLMRTDILIVHVRETDWAGHARDPELKVFALEQFDELVLRPLWAEWDRLGDACMLIACTHKTLCSTGSHENGHVPFILYPPRGRPNDADAFYELCAQEDGLVLDAPWELTKMALPIKELIRTS